MLPLSLFVHYKKTFSRVKLFLYKFLKYRRTVRIALNCFLVMLSTADFMQHVVFRIILLALQL